MALDTEVRGLESRLGEPHAGTLLREPGIGGTCPECGELHASDAHYCARCGAPLDAKARARRDAARRRRRAADDGLAPTPSRARQRPLGRRPAPGHGGARGGEDTQPSLATSQWLALRPHAPAEEPDDAAAKAAAAACLMRRRRRRRAGREDAGGATADVPAAKAEAAGDEADEPAADGSGGDGRCAGGRGRRAGGDGR